MPALNQFTETPIDWTETSTYRLDSRTGVGKNLAIYENRACRSSKPSTTTEARSKESFSYY